MLKVYLLTTMKCPMTQIGSSLLKKPTIAKEKPYYLIAVVILD